MDKTEIFNEFIVENLSSSIKFANIYVKNQHDAEDIVFESIEKALKRIHTLRQPDMVKSWFFRIIINTSIDYIKKRPNTVSIDEDTKAYYLEDFSSAEFDDLLNMLPEKDRMIVRMRFFDNLELKDIAKILQLNISTVKSKLYRSVKKLKLEITKDGTGLIVNPPKHKSITNNITMLIIILLVSTTCIFNLFPLLAAWAYDIPIIGDIIKIITFNRFEYNNNNYEAEIVVPMIKGLLDPKLQARLNAEFYDYASDLIVSFEQTITELSPNDEIAHMSIKADYMTKTDNETILSIDAYIYSDVNSFVLHKFCTIDKRTKTLINLSDLFKTDADYIMPISDYIKTEMQRLNNEENAAFDIDGSEYINFTQIRPEHNFYINEGGNLVICFDKYEVAAGFQGSPEFVIPYEIIEDIISSDLIS